MSPPKSKKRTSILKKRPSTFESPDHEATTTINTTKKAIMFSKIQFVKEFQKEELATNLGDSYETSMQKSDGSSEGVSKFSINETTSCNIEMELTGGGEQVIDEAEKENVAQFPLAASSLRRTSSLSSTNSDCSSSTINNISLVMNAEERKRMKEVKTTENLNLTNLLENSISPENEIIVRSPRKTIYFSEQENMSVVVHEKVEMKKSDADQTITENITMTMSKNEIKELGAKRKTDHRPLGMDLTIDESQNDKNLFKKPPVLPIPQPFSLLPKHLIKKNKIQFLSPPIKTPQKGNEKAKIDMYMDSIMIETPTKQLCHNEACHPKKHGITPLPDDVLPARKAPKSIAGKIIDYRKSTDILRDAGLVLSPTLRKTSFDLELDKSRKTIYDADLSLDLSPVGSNSAVKESKTMFDGEIDETANDKVQEIQIPAFDLDHDHDRVTHTATTSGTKNMTLVKAVDIPEVDKRQTINENDLTFAHFNRSTNNMMNSTNMDGTGMSETTNELFRKASRLLKDPMSEVTGVSGSLSSRFFKDEDLSLSDPSKRRKTAANDSMDLDLNSPATMSRPESKATSIRVLSTDNFDISGIAQSHHNVSIKEEQLAPQQVKGRETICAVVDMNINEDDTRKSIPKLHKSSDKYRKPRSTIFNGDIEIEKSDGKKSSNLKTEPKAARETIYMQSDIDIESPQPARSNVKVNKCRKSIHFDDSIKVETESEMDNDKKRLTVCKSLDISVDTNTIEPKPVETHVAESKKRQTILESPMVLSDCSVTEQPENATVDKSKSNTRFTMYENANIIDESENLQQSIKNLRTEKVEEKRFTTFHTSPMNETLSSQEVPNASIKPQRFTIYGEDEISIDETVGNKAAPEIKASTSRQTLSSEEIEIIEETPEKTIEAPACGRPTTYENVFEIEAEVHRAETEFQPNDENEMETSMSAEEAKNDSIETSDMGDTLIDENQAVSKMVHHTIHEEIVIEEIANGHSKHRTTTYTGDISIDHYYTSVAPNNVNRFTIHEDAMEIDDFEHQSKLELDNASRFLENRREADSFSNSISIHQDNNSFEKDESTLTNLICPPPANFTDSPVALPTVDKTSVNPTQMSVIPSPPIQQTFTVESDVSVAISEFSLAPSRRNFVNITVTDFNNSNIENESDPCMQISSETSSRASAASSRRSSINALEYRKAMHQYVNLTLNQSQLNETVNGNATIRNDSPVIPAAANSILISTPVDFTTKLKTQLENVRKRDSIPEKSDLDDFFEKLNIEPLRIPHFRSLETGFLEKEAAKTKENVDKFLKERRERKTREAKLQLPEIPSYSFLIQNKIECIDEDVAKRRLNRTLTIAPVFPEQKDFDFLLENKFKSDRRLKHWTTDFIWAYKNNYKFHHKKLPALKLNFMVQNPSGNLNDSTIPIYFKQVLLYHNPDYRGELSLRMQLLIYEFHRHIGGIDNFVSMCKSTQELMDFLHFFESKIEAAVQTVDKFFGIVNKYEALIEQTSPTSLDIVKMCLLNPFEICEVSINLRGYIEEMTINNVHIASTAKNRQMEPKHPIIDCKGLMLLEVILYDTEKFVQANTKQLTMDFDA